MPPKLRVALALTVGGPVALVGCENPFGASDDRGILWEVHAQGAKTTPLILESLLVFGTLDGTAIAFDRESGDVRWKTPLGPGSVLGETVEEAAGLAIIPKYAVWALDPENGAVRWTFDGPDDAAGTHDLATSGDTVFTASAFGWASAVDARTGQAIWNVDLLESPFRPTVTEDLVIYGTRRFLGGDRRGPLGTGHVIALRRTDGSEAWRHPLPDLAGLFGGGLSGGAVWNDRLIVAGVAGQTYALSLSDGSVLWEETIDDPGRVGYILRPMILGDVAVFARTDNAIEARELLTGALKWVKNRPVTATQPVVLDPHVYVIDGPIQVLRADGSVDWQLGGLNVGVGLTFLQGRVSAEGIIYTLGQDFTGPGVTEGTFVFAIKPPVK